MIVSGSVHKHRMRRTAELLHIRVQKLQALRELFWQNGKKCLECCGVVVGKKSQQQEVCIVLMYTMFGA